jgi:hypothetical protein
VIRRPFNSVWFSKLKATATSARSAISTKPNPRHSPETLSLIANAARTSPARAKCVRKSWLVTEAARLPTYTLGTKNLPSVPIGPDPPGRQPVVVWDGVVRRRDKIIVFSAKPKVHPLLAPISPFQTFAFRLRGPAPEVSIFARVGGIEYFLNVRTFLSLQPGNKPGFFVRSYPGTNFRRAICPANYT